MSNLAWHDQERLSSEKTWEECNQLIRDGRGVEVLRVRTSAENLLE